ncbi:MAG: sugar transferase [Thermodesulfobacteriota bacterium]|nr:sugar transferase [Thermodesulfobacteriota bacterium]
MLREQAKLIVRAHRLMDICLTAVAFIGSYFIKKYVIPEPFRGLTTAPNYYIVLLMTIIIWYVIFEMFNLYASYRKQTFGRIFRNMVKAVSTATLIMILCMYIFKMTDVSRIMIGIFYFLDIILLAFGKGIVYKILTHYRKKGFNFRNILIIGSKGRAKDVIDILGDHLGKGYKILGCLEVNKDYIGKEVKKGIKVIGTIDNLERLLWEEVLDELIFAMPMRKIEGSDEYIAMAEEIGISVRIIPDWQIHKLMYRPGIATMQFEQFLGMPTLTLTTTTIKKGDLLIKSAFDYIFAGIAVLLLTPLFLLISFAIKLSSRGPIFYRQERCGLNGRKFMVYKFRTMVADAEERQENLETLNESDGPVFKIRKDPRIIPFVGGFLRKSSMDELPQLINVLRGEMSLVGPRPPIPSEVEKYGMWQRRRLSMKPGLTCLWQTTSKRNEVTFDQWMGMDLEYIDKWSLGLDFKILWKTVRVVLMCGGR